jgi:hypothetical protein
MFRVLFAPFIRSTTAAYSQRFCVFWRVIALDQGLVRTRGSFKVETHKVGVTWDHVTSDAVSKMESHQLAAECSHCSDVTW